MSPSQAAAPVLPPLRLVGAGVLAGGELRRADLALADGRIARDAPGPGVDLTGYLVLPGIVDLYGTAFEHHARPAARAAAPLSSALQAVDREAAAAGVTTAHLAQGWSWEGGRRGPARAEALLEALDAHRARGLTDLRAVLRVETHTVDSGDRLIEAVARHAVPCALFEDRLTGSGLVGPVRFAVIAARAAALDVAPEDLAARVRAASAHAGDVPRHLLRLAEAFEAMGVALGSSGDRDAEGREAWSMRGARICAFPRVRAAAASARAVGDPVALCAPEVVGWGEGGTPTPDLVEGRLFDALASCHAYGSLACAAFALSGEHGAGLGRAWAAISEVPAAMLGLRDRGRLVAGLRADLCVVDAETRAVEATIAGGRVSHLAGGAARRFVAAALAPSAA